MTTRHPEPLGAVAVLGCGYTGRPLVRNLVDQGLDVWATTRDPGRTAEIEALGARAVVWSAPEPVRADTAFVLFPPRGVDPGELAEGLRDVRRVVYCSSTSVYGDQAGRTVTDESPLAPDTEWARARVEAERALQERGAVVVRAAGIYGPGRSIVDRVRAGNVRVTGDLRRPVNLIHVADLVQILVAAARLGRPGEAFLAASGHPIAWIDLAEAAARRLGVSLPAPSELPGDPNLQAFYRESKRCRPEKLAEIGVVLRYPRVLDALEELVE